MNNVFTIIKKEFYRFFRDKRMVITVLLPGILIYVLYSVMGSVVSDMITVAEDYRPTAYVVNLPQSLSSGLDTLLEMTDGELTLDDAKEKVSAGTLDLVVVFPQNFDDVLAGGVGESSPNVGVYYNSSSETSSWGYNLIAAVLDAVNRSAFTVNAAGAGDYDLAADRDMTGKILSMLIPLLMFAMLASACVAVAPEAIAGEKERGTMATMLITPVKRWQLALGKIVSLTCFALLSGISSFLGVILSLPKLMDGMIGAETAALYSVGDYLMIFLLIISILLVIISAFSVLSAYAKSVKEAGTLITPVMMVIILLGVCTMFVSGTPALGLFLIPLMGSGLALSAIMSFSASVLSVALAIVSNVVVAAVLIVLLAFMFKSEKVMFNR